MYTFIFTSKQSMSGKDNYLMHILFDGIIIDSSFVQFNVGSSQEVLDSYANYKIDILSGAA